MNPELSKNTGFSFFSGNATPLQKKVIEQWLQDKDNLEQYFIWLEEWEREHPQFIPDVKQGLQLYKSQIEKGTGSFTTTKLHQKQPADGWDKPWRWWMVAATVTLLLITAFVTPVRDIVLYHTYQTAYGEIKTLQLEDGSSVTLNANSSLKVPRFGFGKTSRQVLLRGEAEFKVTHTADNQRFLVQTPTRVEVEVLGTEFVVNTRAKGTKVVLSKGKVQLKSLSFDDKNASPLLMQPGDVAQVDSLGKIDVQSNQPIKAHTAWKQHLFVFDNTSLKDIASNLQEVFGAEVFISDTTLANRTITGTYKADDANELLSVLSELLDIKLSKKGKQVILEE